MRGTTAKKLRKLAATLCNKERNTLFVSIRKQFMGKDKEGKEVVTKINETVAWKPGSFMHTYRRLKAEWKAHRLPKQIMQIRSK